MKWKNQLLARFEGRRFSVPVERQPKLGLVQSGIAVGVGESSGPAARNGKATRAKYTADSGYGLTTVKADRHAEDREFLPAALEILETPESPIRIAFALAICGLFAAALAWSWFGHLDVFAVAPGKIQAAGRTKVVQPLDPGTVVSIRVKDGDHVKEGDVLIELDSTVASAAQAEAAANLASAEGQIARLRAEISAGLAEPIDTKTVIPWGASLPQNVRQREEIALHADLSNLAVGLDNLKAQRTQQETERDKYSESVKAQEVLIGVISELVGMQQVLEDKGWASKEKLLQTTQSLRQAQLSLATLRGSLASAIAAISVIDSEISQTRQTFVTTTTLQLVTVERQVDGLASALTKASESVADMTLKAPISGTIQASAVTTLGQVVATGQQLMQVVPQDAPLEIEAYVLNSDVGFISTGQQAVIKVDSFPYTRYGTIDGIVTKVATDAMPGAQAAQQQQNASTPTSLDGTMSVTTAAQQTSDLVFPVIIVPSKSTMTIGGKEVPLSSGMTVNVEIKTESRRAIDYILSPIASVLSTAGMER
jgi:hemolysin D